MKRLLILAVIMTLGFSTTYATTITLDVDIAKINFTELKKDISQLDNSLKTECVSEEDLNVDLCCRGASATVIAYGQTYFFFGGACAENCALAYIMASNNADARAKEFVKGLEQ